MGVGRKRGKGSFGEVVAGKGVRLEMVEHVGLGERTWYYRKWDVAVKRLKESEEEYKKRNRRIPFRREHLMLEMLREVKYHEAIRQVSRQLSSPSSKPLPGLDSLILLL